MTNRVGGYGLTHNLTLSGNGRSIVLDIDVNVVSVESLYVEGGGRNVLRLQHKKRTGHVLQFGDGSTLSHLF